MDMKSWSDRALADECNRVYWWARGHAQPSASPTWSTGERLEAAYRQAMETLDMAGMAALYRAIADVCESQTKVTRTVVLMPGKPNG